MIGTIRFPDVEQDEVGLGRNLFSAVVQALAASGACLLNSVLENKHGYNNVAPNARLSQRSTSETADGPAVSE